MRKIHPTIIAKVEEHIADGVTQFTNLDTEDQRQLAGLLLKFEDTNARFDVLTEPKNSDLLVYMLEKCLLNPRADNDFAEDITELMRENAVELYAPAIQRLFDLCAEVPVHEP